MAQDKYIIQHKDKKLTKKRLSEDDAVFWGVTFDTYEKAETFIQQAAIKNHKISKIKVKDNNPRERI